MQKKLLSVLILCTLSYHTLHSQSFFFKAEPLTEQHLKRMSYTWHPDAPVKLSDLRHIQLNHYDFDGSVKNGELVAHKDVVADLNYIFEKLFDVKFPITSIKFVDEFNGSDDESMIANNTSAFFARYVDRTAYWSNHSFGCAIDINPLLNPYSRGNYFSPKEGQAYLDRTLNIPGMITKDSYIYRLFIERGWQWGGECFFERNGVVDRHHFQKIIPGLNKTTN